MRIKKEIYISLIVFSLIGISFTQLVNGAIYHTGIKKDDVLTWRCNVCNRNMMNNTFGNEWNQSGIFKNVNVNLRMKWDIKNISYNKSELIINYTRWIWSKDFDTSGNASKLIIDLNTVQYYDNFNFSTKLPFIEFILPIPIRDYLENINFNSWYEVDTRVINIIYLELDKGDVSPNYPHQSIRIVSEYRSNGILDSFKIYLKNNQVIFDITLDSIPIYSYPITILLIIGALSAFCYYFFKVKKNKKQRAYIHQ